MVGCREGWVRCGLAWFVYDCLCFFVCLVAYIGCVECWKFCLESR